MRSIRSFTTIQMGAAALVPVLVVAAGGLLHRAGQPEGDGATTAAVPDPGVGPGAEGGSGAGGGNEMTDIVVTGSVDGLHPGSTGELTLQLRNDNDFPVDVTSIDVAVADASPACTASNLRADGFRGLATLAANGVTGQALTVRMSNDVPDACQHAAFPLTFSVTAVKR